MAEKEDTGQRLRRSSDRRMDEMSRDIADLKTTVRQLQRVVMGDDGDNGIRGDVAEIKESLRVAAARADAAAAERQVILKTAKMIGVGLGALIPIWDILFRTLFKPLLK